MHTRAPSHSSADLLAAARRLEAGAGRTTPQLVAETLVDVEATLRALDRTCLAAGATLIPAAEADGGICSRYRAAAERWDGDEPPSRERQAQILACLHDAGATLRAAADCCRRARGLLRM